MQTKTEEAAYNSENVFDPLSAEMRAGDILERFTQYMTGGVYADNRQVLKDAIEAAIEAAVSEALASYRTGIKGNPV